MGRGEGRRFKHGGQEYGYIWKGKGGPERRGGKVEGSRWCRLSG